MVDLASRVRALTATATVAAVLGEADAPSLRLDRQWRPDLPVPLRHELETHAILRADHAHWWLVLDLRWPGSRRSAGRDQWAETALPGR